MEGGKAQTRGEERIAEHRTPPTTRRRGPERTDAPVSTIVDDLARARARARRLPQRPPANRKARRPACASASRRRLLYTAPGTSPRRLLPLRALLPHLRAEALSSPARAPSPLGSPPLAARMPSAVPSKERPARPPVSPNIPSAGAVSPTAAGTASSPLGTGPPAQAPPPPPIPTPPAAPRLARGLLCKCETLAAARIARGHSAACRRVLQMMELVESWMLILEDSGSSPFETFSANNLREGFEYNYLKQRQVSG